MEFKRFAVGHNVSKFLHLGKLYMEVHYTEFCNFSTGLKLHQNEQLKKQGGNEKLLLRQVYGFCIVSHKAMFSNLTKFTS